MNMTYISIVYESTYWFHLIALIVIIIITLHSEFGSRQELEEKLTVYLAACRSTVK
jgi:hypothetical protein